LEFEGQTVLLTHHQPFSAYEKIIGVSTKLGYQNQQIDGQLYSQLFDVIPKVSVWYWGH
jgi:hypothetical protein